MPVNCIYPHEKWMDQTRPDSGVTSPNTVTMSRSSSNTMTNDFTATGCFSDVFQRLDIASWPNPDISSCETPPYSHDIYADSFSINNYDIDLNDIEVTFDCDISTLDSYLHSPSCSSPNLLLQAEPSSCVPTQLPSAKQSPVFDKDAIEEFFPDLYDNANASVVQQTSRRRNQSSGTVTSTIHYSPYSLNSSSPNALSDYREKRDKNNLASQRSRQKRVEKQREMRHEKEMLERRNIELRTLLTSLEVQVADYKHIVLMMMSKSKYSA